MILFIFILFFCVGLSQNQQNHIDGVLAVVGTAVVLKSDVFEQALLLAKQKRVDPKKSPLAFEALFKKVLNEKINRLVVLSAAQEDSLLAVSFDEINSSLEERIASFVAVFGSEKALEDTLQMSVKEIKKEYWEVVREELYVEKFRLKNFSDVVVNKQEVVSFFIENPDSFPSPEPVAEFSVLEKPVTISSTTKDSVFSLALSLRDSILSGSLLFEDVAKKHSQDLGSAGVGGDLNYTQRGSLLPVYERAAFSLGLGEISFPVESVFGLHLIKLVDRVGEKIHSKHILFTLSPGPKDLGVLYKELEAVLQASFNDPGQFDSLCISSYKENKNLSGYFVDFNLASLPLFLQKKLFALENYSFSDVFVEGASVFLLYKYKQKQLLPLSLERDWSIIERVALSHKRFRLLNKWITKQKEKTYVEIFIH